MLSQQKCERAPERLQPTSRAKKDVWCRNSDAVPRSESVCASRFQCRSRIAHQIAMNPRELSRTSKTASCTSHKDKLGTNVRKKCLLVSYRPLALSCEKPKQARRLCTLCLYQFACTLSLQVAVLREKTCALDHKPKAKMLSLTLLLLLAVEAQKNRAPVCAIGLKKGARVRLPGGARKASPALQIRVRKQLPIPIIPGAHVATLKGRKRRARLTKPTYSSRSASLGRRGPFKGTLSIGRCTRRSCCAASTRASPAVAR